jgi:hypothetical protein
MDYDWKQKVHKITKKKYANMVTMVALGVIIFFPWIFMILNFCIMNSYDMV